MRQREKKFCKTTFHRQGHSGLTKTVENGFSVFFLFRKLGESFSRTFFFLRCFLSSGNLIRFSHTLFECWFKRSSTEKSKKKKSLEVSTFALISIIRFFLLNEVAVMIFHRSFFLFPRIYPAVGWTDIFKWRVDGDIAGNEKNGRAFQA